MNESVKNITEIGLLILMAIGLIGILIRIFKRDAMGKPGITTRSIQFLGVSLLIPTILLLGLESILSGETIATLVGAMAGYLLSGISDSSSTKSNDN
jgi:hypothetical protein